MDPTCPNCGADLVAGVVFCPACGEMVDTTPPTVPTPVVGAAGAIPPPPAVPAPPAAPAPAPPRSAAPPAPPAPAPAAAPVSAPKPAPAPAPMGGSAPPAARPPAPASTPASTPAAPSSGRAAWKVAAVLAALLIVGAIGVAIGQSSGSDDSGDSSAQGFETTDDPGAGSGVADGSDGSDLTDVADGDGDATTAATSPPTTAAPAPGTVEVGRWILVLASEPKGEKDLATVQAEAAQVGSADRGITVLSSDDTPGLNGGYWVVAVASFDSRDAAVGACASFGRAIGGACYPTRVGDGAR